MYIYRQDARSFISSYDQIHPRVPLITWQNRPRRIDVSMYEPPIKIGHLLVPSNEELAQPKTKHELAKMLVDSGLTRRQFRDFMYYKLFVNNPFILLGHLPDGIDNEGAEFKIYEAEFEYYFGDEDATYIDEVKTAASRLPKLRSFPSVIPKLRMIALTFLITFPEIFTEIFIDSKNNI